MEIIEQIGSYAGLAAIVGLAVLSALYFSQARDVRRLREGEQARGAGQVAEQPGPARGPQRPTAVPVPGRPGAAGDRVPADQPAAAQTQVRPAAAPDGPAVGEGDEPAVPASGAPAQAASAQTAASAGNAQAPPKRPSPPPASKPSAGQRGNAAGQPPPAGPAPPRLPTRRSAASAALRTASTPAAAGTRRPWYGRLAPRYLALILAGVLVLTAGTAYAITALVGEDDGAAQTGAAAVGDQAGGAAVPLDPSTIEVAVLNGTEVSGLAAQVADSVESAGFQRGNVANATQQASAESAVLFAEGARRAARQVGRELNIAQIEPIDEESQMIAGTADVVVVVGADLAE